MTLNLDPVTLVNFLLAVIILVLGTVEYTNSRNATVLLIGAAFGLFALSHLITLLGYAATLSWFLVLIRLVAYLIVICAMVRIVYGKKEPSAPTE
ncbi:MAG TPA: hypothetical protein VMT44_05710 [Methanoregula sp.]|nr:hypothetical protein [Methanoregula sp.]